MKIKFSSDEAPPRFQCALDKTHFTGFCESPFKAKVEPGKHKFLVRAVDAGNLRPEPGEDQVQGPRQGDLGGVSATVLYMSMSLDGFIAGPNESDDNGLGDGGHRLHEWVFQKRTDRRVRT